MTTFKGTVKNDKNNGSKANDSLTGLAGSDTLSGGLGDDFIDGGVDNDLLNGETGNDTLVGGDGKDTLNGGSGDDKLDGGKGNDKLSGDTGNDTLNGGAGVDTMTGGDGNDYYFVDNLKDFISETNKVVTTGGNDTIESVLLNYTLPTNVENLILGGIEISNGTGNKSDNVITGNLADNYLRGDAGNDKLIGNAGVDTLDGGLGSDVYFMNNTEDTIVEEVDGGELDQVNATVSFNLNSAPNVEALELSGAKATDGTGNELNNLIQEKEGGTVVNSLSGMAGDDTLDGAGGDDTLEGGEGNDILEGGDGTDTAIYNDLQKNYQITANVDSTGVAQLVVKYVGNTDNGAIDEGEDILSNIEIIQFSDGSTLSTSDVISGKTDKPIDEKPVDEKPTEKPVDTKPSTSTTSDDAFEIKATTPPADMVFDFDLSLTDGADKVDVSAFTAKAVRLLALGGDDTIQKSNRYDGIVRWIDGGDGNDSIKGGYKADTLLGGTGDDSLDSTGEYQDYMGHAYYDSVKNVLSGGTGNDTLYGGRGGDILIGGEGNDLLKGEQGGNDSFYGGLGDDSIQAGGGDEYATVIDSGIGNDTIKASSGNDTINAGAGVDLITGGGGADIFIFAKGDSGIGEPVVVKKDVTAVQRDKITDFEVGSDIFDFSAISNGKLSYIGTAAFSGNNQVRYELDFVHSITVVKLNLDNDPKTTEMEIELTGFKNLTADDFVLVKSA